MAAALAVSPPAPSLPTKPGAHDGHMHPSSCPACGHSLSTAALDEAKRKIEELEAQMERLKEKATAAVDKCADYEDQIRSLKAPSQRAASPLRTLTSQSDTAAELPRPTTANSTKSSRFSFITNRFPSPANAVSMPPPPPPPNDYALLNELERERALRAKAEARVQTVDTEIEELSVQLFSQANEMVAEERRARAKLEERIEMLERRDREKMGRLDRLEKAVSRVERVKALLNEKEARNADLLATTNVVLSLSIPSRR
ncbi:hypothetical protein ACJQWK_10268 [Exserohilum turcicum]